MKIHKTPDFLFQKLPMMMMMMMMMAFGSGPLNLSSSRGLKMANVILNTKM
jgi:hypothetical protein